MLGKMEALGFGLLEEASLQTLTQDVVKTSEIEGEILSGAMGREIVHFQEPDSEVLAQEMAGFIEWFNLQDVRTNTLGAQVVL